MDATPGVPSGASEASPVCRTSILIHLNPLSLYNPRKIANALYPLSDAGVQPSTIWTGGLEYNF